MSLETVFVRTMETIHVIHGFELAMYRKDDEISKDTETAFVTAR